VYYGMPDLEEADGDAPVATGIGSQDPAAQIPPNHLETA
jgi:hypothetical protein